MSGILFLAFVDTKILETSEDGEVKYRSLLGDQKELDVDYRYKQTLRLQQYLKVEHLGRVDVADFEVETVDAKWIAHSIDPLLPASTIPIKLLISSFLQDIKFNYRLIKLTLQHLKDYSVDVTIIEDLIYVPRPYIFESAHNNFFKNSLKLPEFHDNASSVEIKSSNEILNQWGEGDTYLVSLPELKLSEVDCWTQVHNQINFTEMLNQGNAVPRLICIQSIPLMNAENDKILGLPVYRHPNDEEPINLPFSEITKSFVSLIEKHTGIMGINHVLIQFYRDGRDNIAAHSDKTLDIDFNTPIINLSIGNTREMYLTNKQNRQIVEKISLKHGEALIFGLHTNQHWYHEVPKNVTITSHPLFEKGRVSFTFRKINTFYSPEYDIFFGQGSPWKELSDYLAFKERIESATRNGTLDSIDEKDKYLQNVILQRGRPDLIAAFSKENKQSDQFSWNEVYGEGFVCK